MTKPENVFGQLKNKRGFQLSASRHGNSDASGRLTFACPQSIQASGKGPKTKNTHFHVTGEWVALFTICGLNMGRMCFYS
ncbi:hypothetical protein HQN87_12345 [Paenibacillus tritici]|uniref:Transposase DDE domain-containing protein n=1 Tax=Paenibacillus tritici TaxID=1873425 RepID=A0ABX2DND9_9BACL|nr:hypothetical protein [Paenibacillus tritici]NQX46122.1 hypothetical protein [Paenibacillus tritici]